MASQFKIVLLGEGCVGKTSIVLRYCQQTFNENHVSTLQASFLKKKINLNQQRVELAIWDTAGQEKFHALGPIYYRNSHGAVLVYDITDQDSFQKVKNWVRELKKMLGSNIALTICGNKSDLERQRTVDQAEAEAYAASVGAKHFQTSARLNRGIDEMFLDLAKRLVQQGAKAPKAQSRVSVLVEDDDVQPDSKGGCC
ncbi:rab family small GTPase [Salpingoeca rosetta]|uniref:Ras-related protein Rab-21 n=1 Tax=Salpingoeca rosetta (strain ATCC 50818 / BSB-021) TaxID=946362 RepID=F2UL03_SALR5|nr:rab family small GTPase [Salpingoeca rosetta]EGD77802.1 rab family small GTPase [Salpingoeca rosetta]|eukprot:XP_004990278.1 rab family small GTPase [Salpingoeca rosetta]